MHVVLACDANQDAEDMHIVEHVTWAANKCTDAERTQEEWIAILCCQEISILVKSFLADQISVATQPSVWVLPRQNADTRRVLMSPGWEKGLSGPSPWWRVISELNFEAPIVG